MSRSDGADRPNIMGFGKSPVQYPFANEVNLFWGTRARHYCWKRKDPNMATWDMTD